jgi:hypothetical protein
MARRSLPFPLLVVFAALAMLVAACSDSNNAAAATTVPPPTTTTTTAVTTTTTPTTTTTATTTTTTTTPGPDPLADLAAATCDQFDAAPFPARHGILEQQASTGNTTADDLLRSMETSCSDTATTYEELGDIASLSAQLRDDNDQFLLNDFVLSCGDTLSATITNGYSFNIGVVAALYRGTDASNLDATAIVVLPLLAPGETATIDRQIGSSSGLQCGMNARAFLAPDSSATDTWAPAATARALPDTTGTDWLQVMRALIATEEQTANQGPSNEFGMTEDVRSAEYTRLVAGTEITNGEPTTEVTDVCDATELTTDLVNVTYVATSAGSTYTASGLFRKSPQDGRWRWLQLSFYLGDGNTCSKLDGVSLQMSGQQA